MNNKRLRALSLLLCLALVLPGWIFTGMRRQRHRQPIPRQYHRRQHRGRFYWFGRRIG